MLFEQLLPCYHQPVHSPRIPHQQGIFLHTTAQQKQQQKTKLRITHYFSYFFEPEYDFQGATASSKFKSYQSLLKLGLIY